MEGRVCGLLLNFDHRPVKLYSNIPTTWIARKERKAEKMISQGLDGHFSPAISPHCGLAA